MIDSEPIKHFLSLPGKLTSWDYYNNTLYQRSNSSHDFQGVVLSDSHVQIHPLTGSEFSV